MGDFAGPQHHAAGAAATPDRRVLIEVDCVPVASEALARAGVPVVSTLTLTGLGAATVAVRVTVQISGAGGLLGTPVELDTEVAPGRTTVCADVGLVLDPETLAGVRQPCPGWIDVRVEDGAELLGRSSTPIQVLAAGQWLAAPAPLALEMLAAHVQPDHPAIAGLVGAATDLLQLRTGDATVGPGSAAGQRIDETAAAIVEAVRRRAVRAAAPAASWTDLPQQVRTPADVLEGRAGSCLDTVVVLAAALEHAGIRPLLWLAAGDGPGANHAFLGYWRVDRCADSAATTEVTALADLVHRGLIQLVETTMLSTRAEPATFGDLHRTPAAAWLTGDLDRLLGVTDVHRARLDGIRPLPLRLPDATATAQAPGRRRAAGGRRGEAESAPCRPQPAGETAPLLDLGGWDGDPDAAALALTVPPGRLPAIAELLDDGRVITLLPADQLGAAARRRGIRSARDLPPHQLGELLLEHGGLYADVPATAYPSRMGSLTARARTVVEETGANDLHLALGSLSWEVDGRWVRSPLLLAPVVLSPVPRTGAHRIVRDPSAPLTSNGCLLTELQQRYGLSVPALSEPGSGGAGAGIDVVIPQLRQAVIAQGLPFRVEPTADLALLPAAAVRVRRDAAGLGAASLRNPLVAALLPSPARPFADPVPRPVKDVDPDELAVSLPLPADASQLSAIAEARAGRSFVLIGAPGTGKSQTITNLAAAAVADGKRVLVVAGKRTALDVLAGRLTAAGLGPLTLDLHGAAAAPDAVRRQLCAARAAGTEPPAGRPPVDTPRDGRGDDQPDGTASGPSPVVELRHLRRCLTDYAERLHTPNTAGLSLYAAHTGDLVAVADTPLPVPASFVANTSVRTTASIRRALETLPGVAARANARPEHPWGFLDTPEVDPVAVQAAAEAFDRALDLLPSAGPLARVCTAARTPEDLDVVADLLDGPTVLLPDLDETLFPQWAERVEDLLDQVAEFTGAQHPCLELVEPEALDLPLVAIDAAAREAAGSSRFGRAKRLSGVLEELAPVLRAGVQVDPADVPELAAELLELQVMARELAVAAADLPGLQVPWTWNPLTAPDLLDPQIARLRRLGAAMRPGATFTPALRGFIATEPAPDPARAAAVRTVRNALTALPAACATSAERLEAWAGDAGLLARWQATRDERAVEEFGLPSLGHWLDLLRHLHLLVAAGLTGMRNALLSGAVPATDAAAAFDRGLAEASCTERGAATGLTAADADAQEQRVRRLLETSAAVREGLPAVLRERALAARPVDDGALPRPADDDALAGRVDDGGAPDEELPALLASSDVAALTRCVLAGPDAVARFLPPTAGSFDLVVFDESSSLRLSDALGALGRAGAAVVVGDDQQLLPATGPADVPDEGLLTACLRAGVPRHELSWHYRSQDESLIAFSNAVTYGHRLSTFPAPGSVPAVSLVRVPGTFVRTAGAEQHTNPEEARAVVTEVRRRFDATPDVLPSIGVVTLHPRQRTLIEDLLRQAGDDRLAEALDRPDGVFVRTVETVQGEERDTVLLSLGCSADGRGRLPLDFGPLSRVGGERCLTVATTRARRQVAVFASFDPALLRGGATSSIGVRHLRAYLDLAVGGAGALPAGRPASAPDPHREQVADALRQRGLVVRTDVGLSAFRIDLTLARASAPEQPLVAVLLDGPAWAARSTVGDRDALPSEVLGRLRGWPAVERVWLPAWLADREAVLDRLAAAVEAAEPPAQADPVGLLPGRADDPLPGATAETEDGQGALSAEDEWDEATDPVRVTARPAVTPVRLAGEAEFSPWSPKPAGEPQTLRQLENPEAARLVRRVLTAGIAAEGPIHRDRLARLTAAAFGVPRVNAARIEEILALLPDASAEFRWPAALDRTTWTGFRRQAASGDRPLEHVAPEEIGNAMVALCRAGVGMTRDELFVQTLGIFGHRRRHPVLMPYLEVALAHAVRAGRVRRDGAGQLIIAAEGRLELVPPQGGSRRAAPQRAAGVQVPPANSPSVVRTVPAVRPGAV